MASLKDQLDQAGYDTSNLDETAVLKQLSDAGYDTSGFTTSPSLGSTVSSAVKSLLPSTATLSAPLRASEKLGTQVEAGYGGVGDIVSGQGLDQASKDIQNIQAGIAPETTAAKVGKFAGSFFTPNQIALTAAGEGAIKPILAGLNKGGELLAPATETDLPGVAKAVGNALSTASGVGTPEIETIMQSGREAVQGAKTFPELADSVADSMNKLTDHIGTLEKTANATLDAKATIPLNTMTDAISSEVNALKSATVPTQATENAQDVLEGMLEKLKNKKDLTQPEVAKWVKDVQSKINWNDPLGTDLNEALTRIQNTVNGVLKDTNPAYADATGDFADAVNLKNDLSKSMGVTKEPGFEGKYQPENVSVTKLKGLLNPDNALQTKKLLGEFANVPGVPNYVDLAKQAAAKAAMQQGWRARLAGLLAGMVPNAGNIASGAVSAGATGAPTAGNAIYQGLTQ